MSKLQGESYQGDTNFLIKIRRKILLQINKNKLKSFQDDPNFWNTNPDKTLIRNNNKIKFSKVLSWRLVGPIPDWPEFQHPLFSLSPPLPWETNVCHKWRGRGKKLQEAGYHGRHLQKVSFKRTFHEATDPGYSTKIKKTIPTIEMIFQQKLLDEFVESENESDEDDEIGCVSTVDGHHTMRKRQYKKKISLPYTV